MKAWRELDVSLKILPIGVISRMESDDGQVHVV